MTPFQAAVAGADLAIFGGLGDPEARLTPADGSEAVIGPAKHFNPTSNEVLRDGAIVVARPEVHAPVSVFARVKQGDVWTLETASGRRSFKVCGAPRRSRAGHRWECDVEPAPDPA